MAKRTALLLGIGAGLLGATAALRRREKRIDLRGRVVIVTGASTGFGFLLAKQACAEGAKVAICARSFDDVMAAQRALEREAGEHRCDVFAAAVDLRDADAARRFTADVVARWGRLDVLINNAGIIEVGPATTMTLDDFRYAMDTNFYGALHATWAALPTFRRQGSGRIAAVVSIGGKIAVPRLLPYTASKWALAGFSEGLRVELAKEGVATTTAYLPTIRTGGHTHALFKGDRGAEYAWFGAADVLPGLSRSAEAAARAVWKAVKRGDPEVRFGLQARAPLLLHDLFPRLFSRAMAAIDRALPPAVDDHGRAVRGEDLHGGLADRWNDAVPPSTRPA